MSTEASRKTKREWVRRWRLKYPVLAREQRDKYRERSRISRIERSKQPEVKKKAAAAVAKWRLLNPDKTKAHRAVFCALRNGTLTREPCFCGEVRAQAHHEDYSKPLEVDWYCKPHHSAADELRRKRT